MFEFLKEQDAEVVDAFKTLINSCFDDSDKDDTTLVNELLHGVENFENKDGE